MTPNFAPKVQEVLSAVVYTLARQTPEVLRNPRRLDEMAKKVPAMTADISVAWVGTLNNLESEKTAEAAARYAEYESQLKAATHEKEYWQGRAPQAVGDMQEQAALLAENAGNPRLAADIRALRIGW